MALNNYELKMAAQMNIDVHKPVDQLTATELMNLSTISDRCKSIVDSIMKTRLYFVQIDRYLSFLAHKAPAFVIKNEEDLFQKRFGFDIKEAITKEDIKLDAAGCY